MELFRLLHEGRRVHHIAQWALTSRHENFVEKIHDIPLRQRLDHIADKGELLFVSLWVHRDPISIRKV